MPAKAELDTLMRDAQDTARWRGHRPGDVRYLSFNCAVSSCTDCGMEMVANTKPAPNEIDISGKAVALNCPKEGGG